MNRRGIGLLAGAAALLSACAGGMPIAQDAAQTVAPAQRSAGAGIGARAVRRPDRRGSWMAPDAKKNKLLYVSDESTNDVYVYSYPKGRLVGTLTGFNFPSGICTNKAGDVYILNGGGTSAVAYAHGGSTPIRTLALPGYPGLGCSLDPKTGDFAVGTFDGTCTECPGFIAIFSPSSGTTTYQPAGQVGDLPGCAYDNRSNLFCDAYSSSGRKFKLFELPAGSSNVITVTVNSSTIKPGPMQWDGKYVAVGSGATGTIDQVAISASGGTIAGTTTLNNTGWVWQSWILHTQGTREVPQGTRIVAPTVVGSNNYAGYWAYPAGGDATKSIGGLSEPDGAAVSITGN